MVSPVGLCKVGTAGPGSLLIHLLFVEVGDDNSVCSEKEVDCGRTPPLSDPQPTLRNSLLSIWIIPET